MWIDPRGDLDNFVKVSTTLQIESLVVAEWNMNDFERIVNYGTYRYRPSDPDSPYFRLPLNYDVLDQGDFYTDANKSKFTFSDFVQDDDEPVLFESDDVNRSLYFDLEQCFEPFRPRSGINKALYFDNKYIDDVRSARRPRYYMASRYDTFKYWNSYRNQVTEFAGDSAVEEVGVSTSTNPQGFTNDIGYFIDDTAPFFVYDNPVPANRIVVKMQTNLADPTSEANIRTLSDNTIVDPLQDRANSSIPRRWRVEYLDENDNWVTASSFDENSVRRDGSPVVDWDGYIELFYGVQFPEEFKDSFNLVAYIDDEIKLPNRAVNGEAYILGADEENPGELYIWSQSIFDWVSQPVIYGFTTYEEDDTKKAGIVQSLVNPKYFTSAGNIIYRDIVFLKGLRLVVETMEAPDTTFDLIELSPRLRADISRYVESYSVNKSIANDSAGIPVGGLLASNGDITILNDDGAFTTNNALRFIDGVDSVNNPRTGSLVAQYLKPNIKFTFYEAVLNVNGYNKYIPLKTMYAENFTGTSGGDSELTIPIRDFFFRVESLRAPSMFFTNVSLTSAVAMLLDSIGFSNYVFKGFDELQINIFDEEKRNEKINELILRNNSLLDRNNFLSQELEKLKKSLAEDVFTDIAREALRKRILVFEEAIGYNQKEISSNSQLISNLQDPDKFLSSIKDPGIPYFFVNPDASVGQALIDLAISCQAAMFFDEFNRLVIMPKEYILPDENQRFTDVVLYGQAEQEDGQTSSLPNIVSIENSESQVFNDGVIQYNIRYIQREVTSIPQIDYLDQDKVYGYKPVLLWEVGESQELKTVNEETKGQSGYALGAAPLNSDLSDEVPFVENNVIINNSIDLGDNVYWLPRFQGYLFANGEIIRYDAIEYNVSGTGIVWMTSNQQYQQYFSKLPFNGKIYPTGNVRIFVEPNYVEYEGAPETENLPQNVRFENGAVKRHGRGQFGTEITSHIAGLPPYWSDNENAYGIKMDSSFIFSTTPTEKIQYPPFDNSLEPNISPEEAEDINWSQDSFSFSPGTQINDISSNGPGAFFVKPKSIENIWVAVGNSGQILRLKEGENWRAVSSGFGSTNINSIAYGDDGAEVANPKALNRFWIAAGNSGQMRRSVNGSTWSSVSSGFAGTNINSIEHANSTWVAVGNSGKIGRSVNGTTWTQVTSGFGTTNINSVAYGDGSWIAVGNSGKMRISTNGVSWAEVNSGFGTTNINSIAYGKGVWIAVGNAGKVFRSTNGTSWNEVFPGLGAIDFRFVSYGNSLWFIGGNSNKIGVSATGVNWETTNSSLPEISTIIRCAFYNSRQWFAGGFSLSRGTIIKLKQPLFNKVSNNLAKQSTRNGIVKNFLRKNYPTDDVIKTLQSTQSGTIQSSALIFSGAQNFPATITKRDFISYIPKELDAPYKHVGTRMRIIGGLKNNDKIQSPLNAITYFNVDAKSSRDSINLDGGSGGIAIGLNPSTGYGYFFEICALTADNLEQYRDVDKDTGAVEKVLHNIIFYKTVRNSSTGEKIPYKLWGGTAKIIVDEGLFVGMDRIGLEENPTVYDLAIEYENRGSTRRFYLFINNTQVAIVDDASPLPEYTNLALFVRGGSECMFEHVYALQNLMAKNTGETVFDQISEAFAVDKITSSQALRKYSMSGFIKSSYLSGISPQHSPNFKIYFEEFGTIMRECVYFNIRYDQAYPALLAQVAPTFGQERGYSISGFYAGSYGAEFLIFNNNDRFVELDETTGNYLRIIGVTFTQNISQELTVDDFFKERSSLSDPLVVDGFVRSPIVQQRIFDDIKSSRKKHGKREFSLNPVYIQSTDDANEMMEWLINKTLKNRLLLDVQVFGLPQLQLGDIVSMDYDLPEGVKFVDPNKQFIVYSIQQNKSFNDLTTSIRIMEI